MPHVVPSLMFTIFKCKLEQINSLCWGKRKLVVLLSINIRNFVVSVRKVSSSSVFLKKSALFHCGTL